MTIQPTTYSRNLGTPFQEFLPVDPTEGTLFNMAEAVMERLRGCAANEGVKLPPRQVIYMSPIPADCEQVAVLFNGWTPDRTWEITIHCNAFRWLAGFSVIITRCTPAMPSKKGLPPTPGEMMEAAKIASTDAELLQCLVNTMDEIGAELSIITQAPQGGFQTVELDISLPVFGALE
jgi:hypothetical protein